MISSNNITTKKIDLKTVLNTLKKCENLKEQFKIKSLALFGSTVRNEATENSDLDFLVEFEGSPTFDKYMDLKFYLEDLFNKPVDLVIKEDLKPVIKEKIIKEAVYVS
jgi:predicted nucleotidyltransferase